MNFEEFLETKEIDDLELTLFPEFMFQTQSLSNSM